MDYTKAKKITEDILKHMGISYDSIEEKKDEKSSRNGLVIRTNDSGSLIGNRGMTLSSLNLIVKKILFKNSNEEENQHFFIDVNDYQERILEDLKNKAVVMAERAKSFGVDVPLPPMSSYERMMVHTFLQEMKGIKTESEGEGKNRKVVIKYIKEI